MWIWIYRIIFWGLFIVLFPFYWPRLWRRGGYTKRLKDRFGCYEARKLPKKHPEKKRFWIQAVSVGELQSIEGLVAALKEQNCSIILTTTTTTGYTFAEKKFRDTVDFLGYFPFDFYPFVSKAFKAFQPDHIILVDSELWPEQLTQAAKRKIPVTLINARLSNRSYERYKSFRFLARWLFGHVNSILAASEMDQKRLQSLVPQGVTVELSGNLKLDQSLPALLTSVEKSKARASMMLPSDEDAQILIGASTWEGEEYFLVELFKELKAKQQLAHLILVPRHPERREAIRKMLQETGMRFQFKTEGLKPGYEVTVVDTMGDLHQVMLLADFAFIGKSLPPHVGGQSPLGATSWGIPSVMGPEMSNFQSIVESLTQAHGAFQENTQEAVALRLMELAENRTLRLAMGKSARTWHASQQGALGKVIKRLLGGNF